MSNKKSTPAMFALNWETAYWWVLSAMLVLLAGTLGLAYAVF